MVKAAATINKKRKTAINAWRHETRLIEKVTEAVWSKLDPEPLSDLELVGINSKIEEMDSLIMKGLNDVRIIGIWGMGGIGKTTLARAVYEKIHKDFYISCFLSNIREIFEKGGLIHLQRELLSCVNYKKSMEINHCFDGKKWIKHMLHNKRVLIVLDDVSDKSQLENLAVKQEWFGSGSRVIITTRDVHLLTSHGVFAKYDIKILDNDESFQLFCQNAFKGDQSIEGYLELSKRVVKYAGGLPLALEVLGSFLCGRIVCEWSDALDKLSKIPLNDITKILKVSYDGLEDVDKNIFLDIACFFKGKPKDWVIRMLKNCGFHPTIGIKVLIEKSMLVDCGCYLEMHDLLQEMGKSIVFQESPNDARRRSRLWTSEDINYVLKRKKGTEEIQCIFLGPYLARWDPDTYSMMWNRWDLDAFPNMCNLWDPEAFSNMWNLRLLIISNLNLPRGIKCFPPALNVLQWVGYTLDALPQGVQLDELVDFDMQHSKIKQLWKETQFLKKLKFINLSHCIDLIRTTDFVGIPNLERLVLEGCRSLIEVHHSLGLSLLKKLNLSYCNINDGSLLKGISGLSSLVSLDLCGNNFVNLPVGFISNLLKLEYIDIRYCPRLQSLPEFPPNMLATYAIDCASMEPLLGTQRPRDLFASLDLQQHWQRFSDDIKLALPGKEIPSWFHNQMVEDMVMYHSSEWWESNVSFIANIPDYCLSSEWWGIAVCLVLQANKVSAPCLDQEWEWGIGWRHRDPKYEPQRHWFAIHPIYEQYNSINQLYICYIPGRLFSTKRLELEFYVTERPLCRWKMGVNWEIKRCGWRVLCKEEGEGSSNNQQEKENCNKCLELEDPIIYPFPRDHLPNVRTTNASDCASMEPLSDTQLLWDLISSLNLQERMCFCPFKLTLIGKKIPSWFHNQNYSFGREMGPSVSMSSAVSVIADMPHHCCQSESKTGIVVCLVLQANIVLATPFGEPSINWKYYTYEDNETWDEGEFWGRRPIHEQYNSTYQVHIFYISDDSLYGKKLKVDFSLEMEQNPSVHKQNMPVNWGIKRCWWRVLCPKDIEACRQTRSEGYNSNIEFASQHLDGFNEVRITEDTHQNQCNHEITEEDGANSYAKNNQQDKGSNNECFKVSLANILSWCPFLSCFLCNSQP